MVNVNKMVRFVGGFFLVFMLGEILSRFLIQVPKPYLDNNSFVVKKRIFDSAITNKKIPDNYILFLGSSGFARGIDCQLDIPNVDPCFNLSIDGSDANVYLEIYKRSISSLQPKPKLIFLELCEMTFSKEYDSQTVIDNYIKSPHEHLQNWWTFPLTNEFKQTLKNQVEPYFLTSALYQLSRRSRFEHWTTLFFPKAEEGLGQIFLDADQKKIEAFRTLIEWIKKDGIAISVIAQGEVKDNVYSNQLLSKTEPYQIIFNLEKEGLLKFHAFPENEGFRSEFFTEGLLHVKYNYVQDYTSAVRIIANRDLKYL